MNKRKMARNKIILISLLIIFQLLFGAFTVNTHLDSSTDKLSDSLLKSAYHIEKIFLMGNFRKDQSNYISFNTYEPLTYYMYISDAYENNNLYYKKLFDYKSEVKKAVHHHFHGSKYKRFPVLSTT